MTIVEEMSKVFRLPPSHWADPVLWIGGEAALNPMKLEAALTKRDGYKFVEGRSLADWVKENYGQEAVDLVERAMKGERRQ